MKPRFPFSSFPNGWFCVALSDDLPPEGVIPLHYFGKDLVLFRTKDGKPHLLDAYCPHLGAHLGYGGQVKEDAIQCPFHGWLFNGNGQCINIPCVSNLPPKAQIQSWQIREANEMIMVYHHEQRTLPTWEMSDLPEYSFEEWTPLRQIHRWKVYSHVQEVIENSLDIAHLSFLHSSGVRAVKSNTPQMNGPVLFNSVSLTYDLLSTYSGLLGSEAEGSLEVTCCGLGYGTACLYMKSIIEIKFLTLVCVTPIDEEYVDIRLVFSIKKVINKPVTRILEMIISKDTVRTFEQDIRIWERKAYCSKPILSEADGPIMQFRRWARQFYSESACNGQNIHSASTSLVS
jgi:nitrite reductase/ring-hydroxylating ferredoxin subunit